MRVGAYPTDRCDRRVSRDWEGQVKHSVEIGVDRLTPSGQVDQDGLFLAVALISLETGNHVADSRGAIGRTTRSNLRIESGKVAVVKTNDDLLAHDRSLFRGVIQTVMHR